jgi:hypothetical protein
MRTWIRIFWTLSLLVIYMTTTQAQSSDYRLNKIWELSSVEHLSGMGEIGEEMKQLDMTSETQLVFEGGGHSETVSYKVLDQEIRLFDKDGNHLGQDIFWKIESLTANELILVLMAREENEKLVRLKYRAKG